MPAKIGGISQNATMTHNQYLMWLGQQLNSEVPAYNMIMVFSIHGQLDVDAFQSAFQALVAGSDVLRTVVIDQDGEPESRVLDKLEAPLEMVDFTDLPDPEAAYQAWLAIRKIRVLDLSKQLFDMAVIKLGANRYLWYFCQHHLISDIVTVASIFDQMDSLYKQALVNCPPAVPELSPYADYIAYENAFRRSDAYQEATAYWQKKIDQPVPKVEFYGSDGQDLSYSVENVYFDLGPERSAKIKELAAGDGFASFSEDMSITTVFSTLLLTTLYRLSGNKSLRLGMPFHARPSAKFKNTLGLFMETGFLAIDINSRDTFISLGEKVLAELFEGLRYIRPGISSGEINRSFNAFLNYLPATFSDFAGMPVSTEWVHTGTNDSLHSLRLQVNDFDAKGNFLLDFELNSGVFDEHESKWLIDHFLKVIDAFIADPGRHLNEFSLLSDGDREQLLNEINDTAQPYPREMCIHQLFERQAALRPDDLAVTAPDGQLTYQQLDQRANQLAHYLRQQGVTAGMLVGLYTRRNLAMVAALYAIMKAGGAYLPIDPDYPVSRIKMVLEDAAPAVLLTEKTLLENLPDDGIEVICLDRDWPEIDRQPVRDPQVVMNADSLAYVMYTSGSTGKPKGVKIHHRGVVNLLYAVDRLVNMRPGDHLLATTTISFDSSVYEIFMPLMKGARLTITEREKVMDGPFMQRIIDEDAVTVMYCTPSGWRLLLESGWMGQEDLILLTGGERLTMDLAQELMQRCGTFWHQYGPTETTVTAMGCEITPDTDQITLGRPYDNTQIYILDEQKQLVPMGVIGELYIGGDGVSSGYLNRPELTAERFMPNPFIKNHNGAQPIMYKTGDLVRYLPDGRVLFLGRNDFQIKIRGNRVELGEIDAMVNQHPAVSQNVTIARESGPGNMQLISYLVPQPGSEIPNAREMRSYLRQFLPRYMLPAQFEILDSLPRLPNGKINRLGLPEPSEKIEDSDVDFIPPSSPIEELLVKLWSGVLNQKRLGVHDNFFDLGGTSIDAVEIVYEINSELGVQFPLRSFFNQPQIQAQSLILEELLLAQLEALDDEEADRLLAEMDE